MIKWIIKKICNLKTIQEIYFDKLLELRWVGGNGDVFVEFEILRRDGSIYLLKCKRSGRLFLTHRNDTIDLLNKTN